MSNPTDRVDTEAPVSGAFEPVSTVNSYNERNYSPQNFYPLDVLSHGQCSNSNSCLRQLYDEIVRHKNAAYARALEDRTRCVHPSLCFLFTL